MSDDFRPILNGRPALSLELLPEIADRHDAKIAIDWPATLQQCGFDRVEIAYLLARLDGTKLKDMPRALGMDECEVKRIRQRVDYKLARMRDDKPKPRDFVARRGVLTSVLAFWEPLECGRVFSLTPLNETFIEIMAAERKTNFNENV